MIVHNPPTVAAPSAAYSQGIEVPPGARWLYISGQIAVDLQGTVPEGIEAQAALVFQNLNGVLASAGMDTGDLVKITMFLTRKEDIAPFRALRDRWLGSARPSSTLVVVQSLVRPEWLVEVEAVAAKA
jgi:enamine deaminase RidA (YjgF/YER057c/UK114 family)